MEIEPFVSELVYDTTFGCDVTEQQALAEAEGFLLRLVEEAQAKAKEDVDFLSGQLLELRKKYGEAIISLGEAVKAKEVAERRCKITGDKLAAVEDCLKEPDAYESDVVVVCMPVGNRLPEDDAVWEGFAGRVDQLDSVSTGPK